MTCLFTKSFAIVQTNTDSLINATIAALDASPAQAIDIAKALYTLDSTNTQYIYLLAKAYSVQADETMSDYYNALALQQDSLYLPALILKSEHELQGNDFVYAKSLVQKINTFSLLQHRPIT